MIKTVIRRAGPTFAAAFVITAAAGDVRAAENQSWLCKYFPSACGSEESPGGLPGHGAGGAGGAPSAPDENAARSVYPDAMGAPEPQPLPSEAAPPPEPKAPDAKDQPQD